MSRITSIEQLRLIYDEPSERVVRKDIGHIDRHCHRFIELCPFVAISSCNSNGEADRSPRGGKPGFVKFLDSKTLIIPDWGGNNRLDTFINFLDNDSIGLMFVVPGVNEILRTNGSAELRTDEEYRTKCMEQGKIPRLVILVHVREVYLHCAKAMMRADLWNDAKKIDREALPSAGQILKDHLRTAGEPETSEAMYKRYKRVLY